MRINLPALLALALALALAPARASPPLPTIGGAPACASLTAPYLLRADAKLSPALGVAPTPTLSWALPPVNATGARVQVFGPGGALLYDSQDLPLSWSLAYPASAPALAQGAPHAFRVAALAPPAPPAWSANATLVPGLAPSGWAPGAAPIWHPNASAQLALLRAQVQLPPATRGQLLAAYAFVTAQPQRSLHDGENGKLLGAYKLYIEGALAGVGPGRPGTCGPVYPGPPAGAPPCAPEFYYDVLDVTELLAGAAAPGGSGAVALALQCFNAPGPDASRVQLQLSLHYAGEDGSAPFTFATSPAGGAWAALDATAYLGPGCCTESAWFYGPQEHWDAALEPVGWRASGYAPGAGWVAAAAAGPFPGALLPKPTLSLRVVQGLAPAAARALSPAHTVYDLGREVQGGFRLEFPPSTPAGAVFAVQAGEELAADGSVRYLMRTGNNYTSTLRTRAGAQVIEQHEYMEFRYLQVVQLGVNGSGGGGFATCGASAWGDYVTPLVLSCPGPAQSIAALAFLSYGAPTGECSGQGAGNDFAANASCDAAGARGVVEAACVGRRSCSVVPSDAALAGGHDPCDKAFKRLAAAWSCSGPAPPSPAPLPPPLPPPTLTAWQVFYPASFAADAAGACPGGAAGTGEAGGSPEGGPPVQFASSSPALDAVFALCDYTVRATNLDIVTDSNTRQRSPVCAEAALATSRNQAAATYERASQEFLTRYMLAMSPGGAGWAEWQALLISSVALMHEGSGDTAVFDAHRVLLAAYLERELFSNATGLWTCDAPAGEAGKGPWACKQPEVDWPSSSRDGYVFVPADTAVNAHYYGALQEYGALAEAAGDGAAAAAARANASALGAAMRALLWNATAGAFTDGVGAHHEAIHATVYAVARGVADEGGAGMGAAAWRTLLARLAGGSIPTGPYPAMFYGEALFRNTSDHGHAAVSLFLLANGTKSYLNMLRQGATTTMEAWTPGDKPNLTWSHPWMAFALQLIMKWLLGIRAAAPGHAALLIQPQPGPLTAARGVLPTARGPVAVALAQGQGWFAVNVSVPGGVGATVCLPLPACGAGARVRLDGGAAQGAVQGDYACVAVREGPHQLACPA